MLMQAKDLEALLSICDRRRALQPIHVSAFWISLCRLEPRGVAAACSTARRCGRCDSRRSTSCRT